jgi:pseudomonalisin
VIGSSLVVGQGLGNTLEAPGDAVLKLATMEGRTLFSSTGDTGSSCPVFYASGIGAGNGLANQGVPLTSYPASSPYVVGVGGTVLYTDEPAETGAPVTRDREYAWTFGGGGDTFFIPEPSWQVGFPTLPCIATPDGTPDPQDTCRGVPDVAAQSGDVLTNGYQLYNDDGSTTQGGGTSLSSPLWAGMWARVSSAAANGTTGFADPALYTASKDPAAYARDFFDVNSADVGTSIPAANGIYAALPGWDYATGLGTPMLDGIICDVDHAGSGRYAKGVAGVCPAFTVAQGTPAPVIVKKAAAKKTVTKKKTTTRSATAPASLAATGLGVGIPLLAGGLVVVAFVLRRRRT